MARKNAFYAQSGGVTAGNQRLGLWRAGKPRANIQTRLAKSMLGGTA